MLEDYSQRVILVWLYSFYSLTHASFSKQSRQGAEARVDPSISKLTKLHYVEAPAIQVRMFGSIAVKPKCINIFCHIL